MRVYLVVLSYKPIIDHQPLNIAIIAQCIGVLLYRGDAGENHAKGIFHRFRCRVQPFGEFFQNQFLIVDEQDPADWFFHEMRPTGLSKLDGNGGAATGFFYSKLNKVNLYNSASVNCITTFLTAEEAPIITDGICNWLVLFESVAILPGVADKGTTLAGSSWNT